MKVTHGFGLRSHDLVGLFDKTNKLESMMKANSMGAPLDHLK